MECDAKLRKFIWQDLEPLTRLFNEVHGIARSERAFDAAFMRQFLSQPSHEPEEHCYLVESRGALVGYMLIAPELRIGRAVASGGVMRLHRNKGIGRALVRTAIEHARDMKASVLHVEVLSEGAEARHLLESEGFEAARRYWQMRWQEGEVPSARLPHRYSLRSFRLDQDEEALARLQNAAFGENWGFSPNTVEEIRARVRFNRGEPEGIIFVVDEGRPIAYNWTLRAANEAGAIGWIAMTGVDPDYRGKGLGRAVVVAGMQYLKSKGVGAIELEVDAQNAHASRLYLNLGFRKVGETVWYEKRLEQALSTDGVAPARYAPATLTHD